MNLSFYYFLATIGMSCILFALFLFKRDDAVLDMPFKDINDCRSYISKLEFIRFLFVNHSKSDELNNLLYGLLEVHFEEMEIYQQKKLNAILAEENNFEAFHKEEIREFVKFVHSKYLSGIEKFKEDTQLMISYCFFLKETDSSLHKKKRIAETAATIAQGFFSSYEMHCLEMDEKVESSFNFQHITFRNHVFEAVKSMINLCRSIATESPEACTLLDCYISCGTRKLIVDKLLKDDHYQDFHSTQEVAVYLKWLARDSRGDKLLCEVQNRKNKDQLSSLEDVKLAIELMPKESQAMLALKYEGGDIIIENCNQSFCQLVRFRRFEILEKSRLM